jgi:hypothetical protein
MHQPCCHPTPCAGKEQPAKKRTANPGVRVQGGRIYDSENGTTCHQVCQARAGKHAEARMPFQALMPCLSLHAQCRQKTVEVKASCSRCTLRWCPNCLQNRYGEEVWINELDSLAIQPFFSLVRVFCSSWLKSIGLFQGGRRQQPGQLGLPALPRRLQLQQLPQGMHFLLVLAIGRLHS